MKTVNSISGGKTSAYLAVHYPADYEVFSLVCIDDVRCKPKDPSIIQYVNAKLEKFIPKYGEFIATAEDDQTLYVMRDLEQYLGKEIIWVRGKSFDDVIDTPGMHGKRTMIPNKHWRYCTEEMKLLPIFEWWFHNIGDKVKMRIGFRADEFDRMERFLNNANVGKFKIPIACSTKGKRLQKHETFDFRYCSMPLVKDAVTTEIVGDYWRNKTVGAGTLFDPKRKIVFPVISNCIHCFWKHADTLCIEANINTPKMEWAASQEAKDMGTWQNGVRYEDLIRHALSTPYTAEMIREFGAACDSGGCHD